MRRIVLGVGMMLALGPTLWADPAAISDPNPTVPLLPLSIPGYELRVLDVRKPVIFQVNGSAVEGSLPVFVYTPNPAQTQAAQLLREASARLTKLGQKPEWTGEELQQVVTKLDQALGLLPRQP